MQLIAKRILLNNLQELPKHPENVQFGAVYGLVASLDRTPSEMLRIAI